MKKNQVLILISVIIGIAAAGATALLVIKHLKEKEKITPANLSFETDFTEEESEEE